MLQEVMKMRFENIYQRHKKRELTIDEAADLLGCSEKTFRRKKVRYEAIGFEGLLDKRLGNKPPNKVSADKVVDIITLYSSLSMHGGFPKRCEDTLIFDFAIDTFRIQSDGSIRIHLLCSTGYIVDIKWRKNCDFLQLREKILLIH